MGYYTALQTKWATLTGTTAAKIGTINALTVPGPDRVVPVAEVSALMWRLGLWIGIRAAATNPGAGAAVAFNDDIRVETMDMSAPIVGQMLGSMVQGGVITQSHADKIKALKNTTLPWVTTPVAQGGAGLASEVTINDVTKAGLS